MLDIYNKYCTSMQNHGLGAFVIVAFISGYNSINKEYPKWFDVFLVLPMIMNEQVRELIKKSSGRGGATTIETLISSRILNKKEKYGAFHNLIDSFKEYTITCIIFGLRTKLISQINDIEFKSNVLFEKEKFNNNIYLASYKLGELYAADKDAFMKLINSTGVNL